MRTELAFFGFSRNGGEFPNAIYPIPTAMFSFRNQKFHLPRNGGWCPVYHSDGYSRLSECDVYISQPELHYKYPTTRYFVSPHLLFPFRVRRTLSLAGDSNFTPWRSRF